MTDVPGRFLDHVDIDPSQRDLSHPRVRNGIVKQEARRDLARGRARPLVSGQQLLGRVVAGQCAAVIRQRSIQLLRRTPGQHDLEPFPLDGGQVFRQSAERGRRRNVPLTDLLIGQAGQLALEYVPVQVKERLQQLAFRAGALGA